MFILYFISNEFSYDRERERGEERDKERLRGTKKDGTDRKTKGGTICEREDGAKKSFFICQRRLKPVRLLKS